MSSGFSGPRGTVKTITPARGVAKVVCRLVPQQQPERILAAAQRHVEGLNQARKQGGGGGGGGGGGESLVSRLLGLLGLSRSPPPAPAPPPALEAMLEGARVTFAPLPFSAVPYETSRTAPALVTVEKVLKRLHGGQEPVKTWMGG